MPDFSKSRMSDPCFHLGLGECYVSHISHASIISEEYIRVTKVEDDSLFDFIYFDGRKSRGDVFPMLYHSKPEISDPPPPKRMVKKTIERWMNVYEEGHAYVHETEREADRDRALGRIACVHLTGEYEVEE